MSESNLEPQKLQTESLQRKFGMNFPDLASTDGNAWRTWIESERKKQEPIMRDKRLHWSRHRHFRAGQQWISTRDGRLWREPQSDVNDLRPVLNVIGPALNFRLGILSEQRPGFRHEPLGSGVSGRETAEAQQAVSEYYFYTLRTWNMFLDAWYHAQTDGVAFVHVFVDKTKGSTKQDVDLIPPEDPRFNGLKAQGYEVGADGLLILPFQDEGVEAPPGVPARELSTGDLACRVLLAHEVLFSPEARSINGPMEPRAKWALVRRMRDVQEARIETGETKIESESAITSQSDVLDMPVDRSMGWQRGLPPFPTRRQRVVDGVPEYLLWIAPDKTEPGLEKGKWLRLVGKFIVESGDELPGGMIPLARFSDGSPDTDIFPRPDMSDWIGDQTAINALLGALLKHARFAGSRILSAKNTILEETYSNIVGSVVEYQGMKPDVFPSQGGNPDAWKLLDWLIKKLEDKTGWSDVARGQLSQSGSAQDVSGRAVLAAQQLFERTFGPSVRAAAEGATEWAHVIVRYAGWLYDEPRLIPAVSGRGDLAKKISSEMLSNEGYPMVYVDAETLMPMPRALRQQLLEDQLDKGRISLATYQKRAVYADVRDIQMGDTQQWERAQWINTLLEDQWEELEQQQPIERFSAPGYAILWQDVDMAPSQAQGQPAQGGMPVGQWKTVHKTALMEIILDERKPWGMRELALERWGIYDQLERSMNDPTGMSPWPPMTLGVPPDRVAAMAQITGVPLAGATGAPQAGSPVPAGIPPGPATSPASEMSGTGTPVASQQKPAPLGSQGEIERQATMTQQLQT